MISGPGSVTRGGLAVYSQSASDVLHAFLASNSASPFSSITAVLASINHDPFDGSNSYGDNPIGDHPAAIVLGMSSKNVGNAIVLMRIFDKIQWQKIPRISVKVIVSDYLYGRIKVYAD